MSINKKNIYFFIISIFFCGSFFIFNNFIFANEVKHILISEIQICGDGVYNEFIELHNPTNLDINLDGWDLKRKTKSGAESNVLNNIEGIIPAYGYFLIIPRANCGENKTENCYKGMVAADDEYTTNSFFANNNTALLYNGDGALVDKVGWGNAVDFENKAVDLNLENNQSLERISVNGIIQDTDNNKNDFILRDNPEPQNSSVINDQNNDEQENNSQEADSNQDNDNDNDNDNEQEVSTQENGANDIIITEFLPNPEDSDRDNEFIEIYNNGDMEVDLEKWILEDKAGSVKKFIIPNGAKISAGKYKTFYSDETRITLNNSGDGVVLRDNKNNIIDETPVSDAVKDEQSYALDKNGNWVLTLSPTPGRKNVIKIEEKNISEKQENSNQENKISDEQSGSTQENGANDELEVNNNEEKQDNSIIFQNYETSDINDDYNYSDRIVISEIYPNPFGRDNRENNYEWIELYNNSDEDINLRGWQIDDILEKGSKTYIIKEDKIIKAKSFAVFKNVQTKIMLNNAGDEVNILWPDGVIVDSIKYEKAREGWSYNLSNDDSWAWVSDISPERKNKIKDNLNKIYKEDFKIVNNTENYEKEYVFSGEIDYNNIDYIEADINDAKIFQKHTKVKITGIVSTPPGVFSDNTFYISGSGIQVFSYKEKPFNINLGDYISIIGITSEVGGEKRILFDEMKDIEIIGHLTEPKSKFVSTADINEIIEGYLITVEGQITKITKDVFYVNDGSGNAKVYIKPQTKIKRPEIEKDDWVVITGQVGQTSNGFRILPRFQRDIKLSKISAISTVSAASLDKQENNSKKNISPLYILLFFISIIILFDWGKMKWKLKK